MPMFCECMSSSCLLSIEVPLEVAQQITGNERYVIIVDGCTQGPEEDGKLIEARQGYSLYEEAV